MTIQLVKAYAAVGASERDFVERVRVHILPSDEIAFETLTGSELTVGGPDLIGPYLESLEAHRVARGSTYIPTLVDHEGAALGALAAYEADDEGIWAILDLWAEGVQARKGRDFVSAFWEFDDFGADGRPRSAIAHEVSLTAQPQFAMAQTPITRITEESPLVAATLCAASYPTPNGVPEMTPEEMAAALFETEAFRDGMAAMIAEAIEAAMASDEAEKVEEVEEVEAMDGEYAHKDEPMVEAVAASTVKALEALTKRIERAERKAEVAASLRGNVTRISGTTNAAKPGVDYINQRLAAGVSLDDARRENAALTKEV